MNSFYRSQFFWLYLFVSVSVPVFAEYSHVTFTTHFTQSHDKDIKEYKSNQDFSHNRMHRGEDTFFTHTPHFSKYTVHDFRDHFIARGYTESEILNQRYLYMLDEFVKYAQTYSGYEDTVRSLYAELKNLSLVQKVCYMATGKYCRKLQKRIGKLYKSLDAIKKEPLIKGYYNTPEIIEKNFNATVSESFAEYETLESVYKSHTPNLVKAINVRSVIYKNSLDGSSCLQKINKSYNLNNNIKSLLSRSGNDINVFAQCCGNELQQTIHQESLDILNHVDNLPSYSVLYDHQEALIGMASSIVDYNHADMLDKAMIVADCVGRCLTMDKQLLKELLLEFILLRMIFLPILLRQQYLSLRANKFLHFSYVRFFIMLLILVLRL